MSIVIMTSLIVILGIMVLITAKQLNQLMKIHEESLTFYQGKLFAIINQIRDAEKEGKKFIAIEDIKRTINSSITD